MLAAALPAAGFAADLAVLSVQQHVANQGQRGAAGMALADCHQAVEFGLTEARGEEEGHEAEDCCLPPELWRRM